MPGPAAQLMSSWQSRPRPHSRIQLGHSSPNLLQRHRELRSPARRVRRQRAATKKAEIVPGPVIGVSKDYVIVDIGYKSEGQIPLDEFVNLDGTLTIKAGDVIDVLVEARENENGLIVLSKEKADKLKVWDEISDAVERDELVEGIITAASRAACPSTSASRRSCPAARSTCARSATSTSSSAPTSTSRSSSSTRSAATSCCRVAPSSRSSARP